MATMKYDELVRIAQLAGYVRHPSAKASGMTHVASPRRGLLDATLFDQCVKRINDAYIQLGYTLGVRFLFSSKATLHPSTKLIVVGINPGGSCSLTPTFSYEEGNGFRTRQQEFGSKIYPAEMCRFFEELAIVLGRRSDWHAFMDEALVSNFCPFRSASWNTLPRKKEAEQFSYRFWTHLCNAHLQPRAIVCVGVDAYTAFKQVYNDIGFVSIGDEERILTGWGNVNFAYQHLRRGPHQATVFLLPHISTYKIIGRAVYAEPARQFLSKIAACLKE